MRLNETTYVCIVSDHNLVELQAILNYRPKRIILIATKNYQALAKRLKKQIELVSGFDKAEILLADTHTLSGDLLANSQQWIKTYLVPLLTNYTSAHILNLTGGTKALAIALLYGHNWYECHYKALGSEQIERFKIVNQQPEVIVEAEQALQPLTVSQAVGLYCEIQPTAPKPPNEVEQQIAEKLWQGLEEKEQGLAALFKVLNKVWSEEREEKLWSKHFIELPWDTFEQPEKVKPWLQLLQKLDAESVQFSSTEVCLPGNRRSSNSKSKAGAKLKGWVAGGWLEDLVYSWLNTYVSSDKLAINLQTQISDDPSSQREVDILLLNNEKICVLEIKADLPPNQSLPDLENQLSGSANRYGKVQKILFIGPELKHKLSNENRLEGFIGRCKGNLVTLCYTKAGLFNVLGKPFPNI